LPENHVVVEWFSASLIQSRPNPCPRAVLPHPCLLHLREHPRGRRQRPQPPIPSPREGVAKAPRPRGERGWGEGGTSQSTVSPERGVIRPGRDDGNREGQVEDAAINQVYNVAVGERTTLNDLFEAIRSTLEPRFRHLKGFKPSYRDFRPGDVRHSLADIGKARTRLGYQPTHGIQDGLGEAMDWYVAHQT
jgi:hypothetical protein